MGTNKNTFMKKLIFTLVVILTTVLCAQAEDHLKFMGIPLTGNINSFQTKLEAKGCKIDKSINQYAPKGVRVFKGQFAGNEAHIYVSYNKTNKTVYRAKVVLEYTDEEIFNQKKYELSDMLCQKYSSMYINSNDNGINIYVTNNLGTINLGRIDMFESTDNSDPSNYFRTTYYLHIDYWDATNSDKNQDERMEDL